jgi:hypothetical protein
MINNTFEPVWMTVRPVPIVRIDFGNGTVLTRTLHGNIATSVCAADGQLLDILPGIYQPEPYVNRLAQFRLLANYVDQQGKDQRTARLQKYHEGQAAAVRKNEAPPVFVNRADMSKRRIEDGVLAVLVSKADVPPAQARRTQPRVDFKIDSPEELADWDLLAKDTELNETVRRCQIHDMLAAAATVRPEDVTKRLYKEVLHADLDDPYLGLGPVLFDHYVFGKEDREGH